MAMSVDADLSAPPDRVTSSPPVITRAQVLPFGELTWENFERLCYRLAGRAERVEYVARYGRSGQSQQGIDLFVRLANGKYEVWQAKRYESVSAPQVKAIVDTFRRGTWKDKSQQLILAVQASLTDTKIQNEIERQAAALKAEGITFTPHGGVELSEILKSHPEVVDDFFGREWVNAFLGAEAANALGTRLDGAEFARVRAQLGSFYNAQFHLLDLGVAMPLAVDDAANDASPSLLHRFAIPDVLVRNTVADEQREPQPEASEERSEPSTRVAEASGQTGQPTVRRRDFVRRASLSNWLADGLHLGVVGEAGSGKSTLLRCIALDLLNEEGIFLPIARRWGGLLPVHIPFSRWSRLSKRLGRAASLKEAVAETLQPALTTDLIRLLDRAIDERRILLLLDGLDEWSDEQAARTTLQHILAFVATHSLPTIATGRPRGLDKIGTIPPGWRTAELAPLTLDQQRTLAEVWFSRALAQSATSDRGPEIRASIEERLDRFFAELARSSLSSLAGTPLLLLGFIALSSRQIALPRNRTQAIQSLVVILLETHPERRATAAGDTQARFVHIPEAEDRRAALGRLAFVARSATGGGTYDIKEAKRTIRDYLADPTTFAYSTERAQNAASEMLAVNAETVGLLAERAPGEIGFAHAVFEEYLAAEHICRWAFEDMIAFVRARSGDPLWRNVISNLVSLLPRPTEVETVVAAIEMAPTEETSREGTFSRDVLLADIAFNSSRKPPVTARRLADRAFDVIECGDWMLARREVLRAALTNLGEAASPTPVDDRLASWTPRRRGYQADLFESLGAWKPAPDLCHVLLGGLHDEGRGNQRSAARALGRLYAGDGGVQQRLRDTLRSTLDLSVAAAALEALTLGWPETPGLSDLHDAAFASRDPTLRLVGIAGRLASGRVDQSTRDGVVDLLSEFPKIDFWDQPTTRMMLYQYWPNDPELVDKALEVTRRDVRRRDQLEPQAATHYLIHCSPSSPRIANWVRLELSQQYPFLLARHDVWDYLPPFAIAHADIRASVIAHVRSEVGRHNLHDFQILIVKLGGDELRDELIGIARGEERGSAFWAVRPLLEGWGRSDPVVASFMDEIASWEDKDLEDLAAILPQILIDFDSCRTRLLSLARRSGRPRFDLIARGLAALGCTAEDTEVIDTLLGAVWKVAPLFDPGVTLLTHFSTNPRVRQYALQTLRDRAPPLGTLAQVYENDAAIRQQILAYANPLPVTLRGNIAEAAFGDAKGRPAFERVLEDYDIEVDGELKIAASIYYHRYVARVSSGRSADHLKGLKDALCAVGPDLSERRAAAFAGMLLLGRVNDIVPMTEFGDKPLHVRSGGSYEEENDSLMALVCERWEDVHQAFGTDLATRFGDYGADEGHLWDCLAPHINESPAARRDFLAFCNQTDSGLGLRSSVALAREQPSSELLLNHCWRVFGQEITETHPRHLPWALQRVHYEIAYILRDHFRDRVDVKGRLREAFERGRSADVVALVLVEPNDPLLDTISYRPKEIAQQFSDWVTALHLASARSSVDEFVQVAFAMINRHTHGIWDFQEITNRAIIERLRRDPEAAERFKDKLMSEPTESEIASLPRYLAAAGAMDEDVHKSCRLLLQDEARYVLPRAGYDAVADSTRSVSVSLLENLAPSFSP
jgi:hypothetical protein